MGGLLGSQCRTAIGSVKFKVRDLLELKNSDPAIGVADVEQFESDGRQGFPRTYVWDQVTDLKDDGIDVIALESITGVGRWRASPHQTVDIRWFGARGDGNFDDSRAFALALSSNAAVVTVPATPRAYMVRRGLSMRKGSSLVGESKDATIRFGGDIGICVDMGEGSCLSMLTLDGDAISKTTRSVVVRMAKPRAQLIDVNIRDGKTMNAEISSSFCSVQRGAFEKSTGTAISITGPKATNNIITGVTINENRGFGVWINAGAKSNVIQKCVTNINGLELIGITYDCLGNLLLENHAESCGDNGISVTGRRNVVAGNVCKNNRYHGIGIFGDENVAAYNVCLNNGAANLSVSPELTYSGISITPNFGGTGRDNKVVFNWCCDDQVTKTQLFGIKIERSQYKHWTKGTELAVNRRYVKAGGQLYRAMGILRDGGRSGSRMPTHRSGSATDDGGVTWRWIGSALGSHEISDRLPEFDDSSGFDATGNLIACNRFSGNRIAAIGRRSRGQNMILAFP